MNAKVLLPAAVIEGQFGIYSSRWVSAIEEEQGCVLWYMRCGAAMRCIGRYTRHQ